jgi:hypothetical protein
MRHGLPPDASVVAGRSGAGYELTMMTLALLQGTPRCRCLPDIVAVGELRKDELTLDGKERLTRVRR